MLCFAVLLWSVAATAGVPASWASQLASFRAPTERDSGAPAPRSALLQEGSPHWHAEAARWLGGALTQGTTAAREARQRLMAGAHSLLHPAPAFAASAASMRTANAAALTPQPPTAKPIKKQQTVLVLISDTGGGHRASAQALEAALSQLRPGKLDVRIVDIWTNYATWPHNKFVSGYAFAAKNPWVWRSMYFPSSLPPVMQFLNFHTRFTCWKGFQQCIVENDPDLVVSMHPLCQELPLRILNRLGGGTRSVPFATVVTDLGGAHPTWFNTGVDKCFVPSDVVREVGRKRGMREDQLIQHGLPVRPAFAKPPPPKVKLAKQLGLTSPKDCNTVLVVGGGDGVGSLEKCVEALAGRVEKIAKPDQPLTQLVVVCGKNAELRARLEAKEWGGKVQMQVRGFVKRMSDYMEVADCLITKAGPGTIAEGCIRGLPTMLSSFLPGQEAGNVPFVVGGGFGAYAPQPERIAQTVCEWLEDPELLKEMSANAKAQGQPRAATTIAEELCEMLPAKPKCK